MNVETNFVQVVGWHFGPIGRIHDWTLHTPGGSYGVWWIGSPESRVGIRFGHHLLFVCPIWQVTLGVAILAIVVWMMTRRLRAGNGERKAANG